MSRTSQSGVPLSLLLGTFLGGQRPRGLCFVQFDGAADAADAMQLDRSMVGGREISVQYAERGRKRPEGGSM